MTWSLFYRFDNEVPTDFYELRQFGSSLWAANGRVETWGHSSVIEFASPQAAKDALVQRGSEIGAQGYKRVRQGVHDPARIDFPLLTAEIRDGARRAFQAVRAANPNETIHLFALGSDDGAMTIIHAASSLALGEQGDMDDESAIWCSAEWPHTTVGGEFLDIAYRMILRCHRADLPCDVEFDICTPASSKLVSPRWSDSIAKVSLALAPCAKRWCYCAKAKAPRTWKDRSSDSTPRGW